MERAGEEGREVFRRSTRVTPASGMRERCSEDVAYTQGVPERRLNAVAEAAGIDNGTE